MVSPAVGKVVLIRFPFSDLSKSKVRPAAIVADAGRDDWILSQITSNPYDDPRAIPLTDESFEKGSLRIESFVRPGKLFTANSNLFLSEVGSLKRNCIQEILTGIANVFRSLGEQGEVQTERPGSRGVAQPERSLDNDKIDEAILALLYLGLHEGARAWKGFDWDAMDRLHEKGFISDPRGKAKSVVFTEEGLEEAQRLLVVLFSTDQKNIRRRE